MELIHVFIYGSLLPGHSNHHVVSPFVHTYTPGQIAGRLVDFGPYPAAIRDALTSTNASIIQGQWITVDRKGLASMDALEGFHGIEESNDYDRIWVKDKLQAELAGWVYVWDTNRGYPSIEETYWPDFHARKSG